MRLNIVPARTGMAWARLGMRMFFKQPLAMSGLFFMFMALLSVASLLPLVGSVLALALLPAATLGLMAATQVAERGQFPMPTILATAFRAGRERARAMVTLGMYYAVGFLLVMGVSALFDGGQFARLYLFGGALSEELVNRGDFQTAMWAALLLYVPLSLMFWHAPALVHWHGVAPAKSLFFSFMACWKNFGAFLVFGLVWVVLLVGVGLGVTLVSMLLGSPQFAAVAMFPAVLVLVSMFFSSLYFTFRGSFLADEPLGGVDEVA